MSKKSEKKQEKKEKDKALDEDFEKLSDEEKLETLIQTLQEVEKKRQQGNKKPPQSKKPVIMLEFGGMFHPNQTLNFLMYYVINLLVIYGVATFFNLATIQSDLWVILLFVLVYTLAETLLRIYIMYHHVKLAFQTLGFIFFFGYVTLFFLIDQYLFPTTTDFASPAELVAFTGIFVFIRYLIGLLVKQARDWRG